MICARCEQLEERVAWLESELGLQRDNDTYAKLRAYSRAVVPGYSNTAARFIMALYGARGRVVSRFALLEAMPPRNGGEDERSLNILSVWACWARKVVGRDGIEALWGRGYRLTPIGMARVAEIVGAAAASKVAA